MAQGKNISETEIVKITDPQNSSRRRAVKTIAGGVGALAAYHVVPVNWTKPIVEQVFLPAHAAVSGVTLSDPCTAELVSGNQETSIDLIRVAGFVTPPVGGLEVTIVATPNGGSGGPVTVTTSTGSDGTYSAEITMVGGPGISGVGATTTVAGVSGVAHCPVGIPPADHPSAGRPQPPTYTLTCETGSAYPPCGSDVTATAEVGSIVTVSPNPGNNQQLTIEIFCAGNSQGSFPFDIDPTNGQANFGVTTAGAVCGIGGVELRLKFSYSGASCDCFWNVL